MNGVRIRLIGTANTHTVEKKNIDMSKKQFVSNIKQIPFSQSCVYAKLSDLNNLAVIREKFDDPAVRGALESQVPSDKMEQLSQRMQCISVG